MIIKELKFLCEQKFSQKKCIILGNGESVIMFKKDPDVFTIGVNDICKFFSPNVLLIIDSRARFERKGIRNRIEDILNGTPDFYAVNENSWEFPYEKTYHVKFGKYKKLDNIESKNVIDISLDSPYVGIQLAYKMGFKKIGVLGVDYTPNHFYQKDGDHELVRNNSVQELNNMYAQLSYVLKDKKVDVYNLSPKSQIKTLPYMEVDDFYSL